MAVVKVIEIIAEGDSIEGAITSGVAEASKTVRNIRSAYVEGTQAIVGPKGKVTKYRVNLKLSFVLE